MTRRLYWEDDTTEAEIEVLRCQRLPGGRYGLYLNATPFHPQGGGQLADVGKIGDTEISGVEIIDGEIIHYAQQMLALGSAVARVDVERRRRNSKLHSAGHLIGHALESIAWRPVKAHHWPGEARVVFSPLNSAQSIEVDVIQRHCDELIACNLLRKVQLSDNQFRKVGFGDFMPYGCGGTHVKTTAELKDLHVLSAHMKKGQLIVHYDIP